MVNKATTLGENMSKVNNKADQINLRVMKIATPSEYIVFAAWFSDSIGYNVTQQGIADRVGLSRRQVNGLLKSLIKKEIIFVSGKIKLPNGKYTNIYDLVEQTTGEKEVENDVNVDLGDL